MSSDVIRTLKWVFGKGGLIEEYKRQEQMLEETPKSVASMTRIFAPQISRDFPGINLEQFEARAQQQLVAALQAISAGDMGSIARASDELKEQVSRQIEGNRAAGVREMYEQIRIHQTEISNYQKRAAPASSRSRARWSITTTRKKPAKLSGDTRTGRCRRSTIWSFSMYRMRRSRQRGMPSG